MTRHRTPAIVDRTDEYDPIDYVLTTPAGWVVAGRAHGGWVIQVALSTPLPDEAWRPGQSLTLRHLRLTITAPSGAAAQYRTPVANTDWSISEALNALSVGPALVPVFTPRASEAERVTAWRAVPIVFATLNRIAHASEPAGVRYDVSEDLRWAAAGFTRRDRSRWSEWLDWPDVAAGYRDAGFTPEEAEAWAGPWQQVPADVALAFEASGWTSRQLRALAAALAHHRRTGSTPQHLLDWVAVPAAPDLVIAAAKADLPVEETIALARAGTLTGHACAVLGALRTA